MSSLNKVFLMGNLTKNPKLRYTPSGTAVNSFGIAINSKWVSQSGETKEDVCFVEVTAFGRRAEVINEYFSKGDPIFIEGRLKYEQWETKEGQKRNALKVILDNFQFIGAKGKQETDNAEEDLNTEEIPF